jgi:hypothetical protein
MAAILAQMKGPLSLVDPDSSTAAVDVKPDVTPDRLTRD